LRFQKDVFQGIKIVAILHSMYRKLYKQGVIRRII